MTARRVTLSGPMTRGNVLSARREILDAICDSHEPKIVVDCSAVDEVDGAFIHLLLGARRGAAAMGKIVALASPASGALRRALEGGGFLAPDRNEDDFGFWTCGRT